MWAVLCCATRENSFQRLALANQVLKHSRELLKAGSDLFVCAGCSSTDFTAILKVIETS